jgi:hypothetical protein
MNLRLGWTRLTGWHKLIWTSKKAKWNATQSMITQMVAIRAAPLVMKRRYVSSKLSLKPKILVM